MAPRRQPCCLLVSVVGGLFAGEPRRRDLGRGDRAGGVDRRQLCGRRARSRASERRARPLRVSAANGPILSRSWRVASSGAGRRRRASRRAAASSAGRFVELRTSVGWLTVEDGLVGGDQLTELAVDGPRVVDGGHGGVGDAGEGDGDLVVGVGVVGEAAAEVDGRERWRCSRCGWVGGSGIGRCSRGRRRGRRCRAGGRGPRCRLGRRRRCEPRRGTRSVTRRRGRLGRSRPAVARWLAVVGTEQRRRRSSTAVMVPTVPLTSGGVAVAVAGVEQDPVAGLVVAVGRSSRDR